MRNKLISRKLFWHQILMTAKEDTRKPFVSIWVLLGGAFAYVLFIVAFGFGLGFVLATAVVGVFFLIAQHQHSVEQVRKEAVLSRDNTLDANFDRLRRLQKEYHLADDYKTLQWTRWAYQVEHEDQERLKSWEKLCADAEAKQSSEKAAQAAYDADVLRVQSEVLNQFEGFARMLALHPKPITDQQHVLLLFAEAFPQFPVAADASLGQYAFAFPDNPLMKAIERHLPPKIPRPPLHDWKSGLPQRPEKKGFHYDWPKHDHSEIWGKWWEWVLVGEEYRPIPPFDKNIPRKLSTVQREYDALYLRMFGGHPDYIQYNVAI